MEIEIGEIILEEEVEINEIELDVEKVYPELEDLEVTSSSIEQNFNHPNSYGYDKVKVKAVESDTLNVTPTTQNQQYTGLYGTVNVSAVDNTIDNNIQPENIKEGVEILGVEGSFIDQADSVVDRTVTSLNLITDTLGSNALRDSQNLITLNAPNLTRVNSYGLYGCLNLKNLNVNIDNQVYATSNSFAGCHNLEGFDFEFLTVNSNSFSNCQKISKVICADSVSQIATNSVFSDCFSLKTLVLRRDAVVTLRNSNSFDNTPFRNGEGGIVYVPENRIEGYEVATNWSSLESVTFKKIEGSIYDN